MYYRRSVHTRAQSTRSNLAPPKTSPPVAGSKSFSRRPTNSLPEEDHTWAFCCGAESLVVINPSTFLDPRGYRRAIGLAAIQSPELTGFPGARETAAGMSGPRDQSAHPVHDCPIAEADSGAQD